MNYRKLKTWSMIAIALIASITFGQEDIVKERFNKEIGDGVKLIKEVIHLKGENLCKSFLIDVAESGEYYINTFSNLTSDAN